MKYKSALMTSASGSLGGITASHNQGGQYFKARPDPVQPNSCNQAAAKAAFAQASQAWTELSPEEKWLWNAYADQVQQTPAFCGPIKLTGQQAYIQSQMPNHYAEINQPDDAPTEFNHGSPPGVPDSFEYNDMTGEITMIVPIDTGASTGGFVLYFVGPPASNGAKPKKNTHFIGAVAVEEAATASSITADPNGPYEAPQIVPYDYSQELPFYAETAILYNDNRYTGKFGQTVVFEPTSP